MFNKRYTKMQYIYIYIYINHLSKSFICAMLYVVHMFTML